MLNHNIFFNEDQALSWINPQVKPSSETKSTVNFIAERMMLCTKVKRSLISGEEVLSAGLCQ